MRGITKKSAWVIGVATAIAVLLAAALLVAGNSGPGRILIERVTYRLTAGHVRMTGLGGSFPAQLTLARLQLIDNGGVWLTAEQIAVDWSPLALLDWRVQVRALQVARLDIERLPLSQRTTGGVSIPKIEVERFSIDVLKLGAQLAGTTATLRAGGNARLRTLQDASADLEAHRTDGDGDYALHLRFDPTYMNATLAAHEPASGPLENILQLPGLGALDANLSLNGPRNAERLTLVLDAGDMRVRAQGSVNLTQYSADLQYALDAPAMRPSAGIGWQRLALHGRWHGTVASPDADGRLDIAGLRLAGGIGIASLSASLKASGGNAAAQALVNGLEIPGPKPMLLAPDPLQLDASVRLNEATRPIILSVTHRLFSVRAQATTAGQQRATLDLRLPDVAPFASLAGQDVRGAATIKAQLIRRRTDVGVTIDAGLEVSEGAAGWLARLGNRVALQVSAAVSEDAVNVERLRLTGHAFTFASSGSAHRSAASLPASGAGRGRTIEDYIDQVQARWNLEIADLGFLSSELSGELRASGRLSGAPSSLAGDADLLSTLSIGGSPRGAVTALLHARGLPGAPSGTARVHGMIDGAPLDIEAVVDRDVRNGVRAVIRNADWKSAHLEAEMSFQGSADVGRGQVRLRLAQLADLDRILGLRLLGSLEGEASFTPTSGRTRVRFQLAGRDLVAGPLSGSAQLSGEGTRDALAVEFGAQAPDLYGAAASIASSAVLNVDARELRVSSAVAHYRGQEFRLLGPARVTYANGWSVDRLKLGAQDAVFEIAGALSPMLDVRASLRRLEPRLVNVFVPDLLAEGAIEGDARLRGTLSAPTGDVSLHATGMRFASAAAAGLPALDLRAAAALADNTAVIDARLGAGSESTLTVSGNAPLNVGGTLDLKILGKLDIAMINPLLEARGMRAAGQLAVNATVAGSMAAPQILGDITLAKGNWRDYARGINLSDISAEVAGSEGRLQIKSFKATAASGTVTMTGSVGVLQAGVPVDLRVIASKAQPIASNIVTANLDADIHVTGRALVRLDLAGTIHVNRATIGIPDSLPPEVVVLDVRRRGKSTPATPERPLLLGFDVTIQAPREILVQGRGLNAELGGELHVGGTSDAPQFSGGFDLQRGSFTIAGSKLNFTAGRVSFDGAGLKKNKIDPTLDFTAQTVLSDTTATLHITGYADAPKFDFSSTTGLAQDEIMARLLFGENASQLSALQAAQVGAALATLSGVGSGANPLVKLQKTLGLDRLSVSSGTTTTATGATENAGTAVQAGRYIAKRVYVEAKQSSTGSSQVQVNVDLTKHLKLQTRLGNGTAITQGVTPENDPGSSIGLSYQFEY
jgi:translocation and assembly module TamB